MALVSENDQFISFWFFVLYIILQNSQLYEQGHATR